MFSQLLKEWQKRSSLHMLMRVFSCFHWRGGGVEDLGMDYGLESLLPWGSLLSQCHLSHGKGTLNSLEAHLQRFACFYSIFFMHIFNSLWSFVQCSVHSHVTNFSASCKHIVSCMRIYVLIMFYGKLKQPSCSGHLLFTVLSSTVCCKMRFCILCCCII